MIRTFLAVAALEAVPLAWTGEYRPSEYIYGRFTEGTAFLWHASAILESPVSGSDTLLVAHRGRVVIVTGPPSGSHVWRGIRTQFYPVVLEPGEDAAGYLPGTDLAMAAIDLVEGPMLLCVLTGSPAGGQGSFTAAVLAVDREGVLLDSIAAVVPGISGSGSSESYDQIVAFSGAPVEGFEGLEQGVFLGVIHEACGRPWTLHLIAWDGVRLVSGPSAMSVSEAGCSSHFEDLVMPGEAGGFAGSILLTVRDEIWIDSLEESIVTGLDTTVFRWNGAEFDEECAD